MSDYDKFKIKEYKYWTLYIHTNQSYLGRCIVWCKRRDALDFADATTEEVLELPAILKDLRKATKKAFKSDWFNYAMLGNNTRHLHCHFIPRYSSERRFQGVTFKDERWGHDYRTDNDFKISQKVLNKIKAEIKSLL